MNSFSGAEVLVEQLTPRWSAEGQEVDEIREGQSVWREEG